MWGHHHNGTHHGKIKMCMILGLTGGIYFLIRLMLLSGTIAGMASRCGLRHGGMHLCSVCGKYHGMAGRREDRIGMLREELQEMQRRLQKLEQG